MVIAERLLYMVARGDRSAYKRPPNEWAKIRRALQDALGPWKGPEARALKKELHEAVRDADKPKGPN
jgi:hypothetical protein